VLLATSFLALAAGLAAVLAFDEGRAGRQATARIGLTPIHESHNHKHSGPGGHLRATTASVELVSTLPLRTPRKLIADVAVHDGFAYLGAWGRECANAGVHVVDLRDPTAPRRVAFVRARHGSYPGEGVQALHLDTPAFAGEVLVTNNETCDRDHRLGGLNLYEVSNPARPKVLVQGFGDRTIAGRKMDRANEIHSVFAWDAGRKAYAVLVDNREARDVDIVDISNPRRPRLVAEYSLLERFPQIAQSRPGNLVEIFHHDVVVKKLGSRQVMLVSYWDGGYVQLDVTDPLNARYLGDTDLTNPDPELLRQARLSERPEGNAHESEFTRDGKYVIAADEDFNPTGLEASTPDDGSFGAIPGSGAGRIEPRTTVSGGTRYVGRACAGDPAVPPPAGATFAVVSRGTCTFTAKVQRVQEAGYRAAIVVNGEGPQGCGGFRMAVDAAIPAFSVSRAVGLRLFDRPGFDLGACRSGRAELLPGVDIGNEGDVVSVRAYFDGWGYVHLYRNGRGKLVELDTYAIPEAMSPALARGRGTLSVHEVATSPTRDDLAYFSYYAGGFRVAKIVDGKLVEVGRFIDRNGNNLWGVQVFQHRGREYVAASDIDFGLYVFRYTGD
jgi:hypothetical protein